MFWWSGRFLELQSSGRKDEIRLHYTHLGLPKVEMFNYPLADGAWHQIAVTVSGGVADLYIDCKRVERRWMAGSPDTSMPPTQQQQDNNNKMSLWVGQRGDQHFLFKVKFCFSFDNCVILEFYKLKIEFEIKGCDARCPISCRKQWTFGPMS